MKYIFNNILYDVSIYDKWKVNFTSVKKLLWRNYYYYIIIIMKDKIQYDIENIFPMYNDHR